MIKKGTKGSSTVEASILFPLIILLTFSGFVVMARWYDQWEKGLEQHRKEQEERKPFTDLWILQREQWGELLEGDDEGTST